MINAPKVNHNLFFNSVALAIAPKLMLAASCSAADAIRGPPIKNQNTYTLGLSRLVRTPRLNEPDVSSCVSVSGSFKVKHSTPILVKNMAPNTEIIAKNSGSVAIHPAKNRLTIISGPSVKMGAAAVHIPAFRPLERDSLITIVSSGPGLIPSMMPRATPAPASCAISSVSITQRLDAAVNLASSLRISK